MRQHSIMLIALALGAAIASSATPAAAQNAALHVNGGGTGLFIAPSVTPTDQGLTTNFSVGAKIFADGSATGNFVCLIQGIVVVNGKYTAGSYNAGTGVATVSGVAILYFPNGGSLPVLFTNTFKAGGPGVGIFTLSETSGYFPNYPTDVDTEVVVKGGIKIH